MQGNRHVMQIITGIYFVLAAAGLFLGIRLFSAEALMNHILPITLALVILWFLLIFAVMKRMQKSGTKKENEEKNEREN